MTYEELILGQSPDRYWRLGDANGQTDIVDETGNVPESDTLVSGATLGGGGLLEGDSDTSASFDGTDDNIRMEDTEVATTLSISLWFSNPTPNPDEGMICKSNSSTVPPSGAAHIGIIVDNLGRVAASLWDGSSHQLVEGPSGADDGERHHVVLTVESGVEMVLYYDGVEVDSTAIGTPAISDHTHWWLGISEIFSSIQNPWSGVLDEVAIWLGSVLTPGDVDEQWVIGTLGPIVDINGAFGGGFNPWADEAWGDTPADSNDVTGALQATTAPAAADFDGTVQNPVIGALGATTAPAAADFDAVEEIPGELEATTAPAQANLDGVVANPVTGALGATTAPAQADLDGIAGVPGSLQAQTADAQANFDGQVIDTITGALGATTDPAQANFDGTVANPVTGALQATTDPAVADFTGIAGEDQVQPPRGAYRPDWREWLKKALEKKQPEPKKPVERPARRVRVSGVAVLACLEGSADAQVRRGVRGAAAVRGFDGEASAHRRAGGRGAALVMAAVGAGGGRVLSTKEEHDEVLAFACSGDLSAFF